MSTPDVLVRALLVIAFAGVAVYFVRADQRGTARGGGVVPRAVTLAPARLERRANPRQRLTAAAGLTVGAIVAGAVLALVVSVVVAYLVTSITGLVS